MLEEGSGILCGGHRCQHGPVPQPVLGMWRVQLGQRGGDTDRDQAARRGCSRDSGQPSVPHRQCLPGEPLLPFTWPCTVRRLSRKALTLWPLFAKGLSPPRSPGAQGHRLSQCQVSPKDPPQTGIFLQEVLLWGIKSSGLKLGLLRGWARPWFKMLPAQLCFPPSLPVSGIPGCSQQWGLSQSF